MSKLTREQADDIIRHSELFDLVEEYYFDEDLGHVYGLADSSARVVTDDGRIVDPEVIGLADGTVIRAEEPAINPTPRRRTETRTMATPKLKRIGDGLYQTPDGRYSVERQDRADREDRGRSRELWIVRDRRTPVDAFPTLAECRDMIAGWQADPTL